MILAMRTGGSREFDEFNEVPKRLDQMGRKAILFRQDRCLNGECMTLGADESRLKFRITIDDSKAFPFRSAMIRRPRLWHTCASYGNVAQGAARE